MLVAVERLLIKLRRPASRADELIELRRRLREELAGEPDEEERLLAQTVQAAKLAVSEELRTASACGSCAKHHPWPVGGYDGGGCCSGVTADLFDDNELAALALAGTRQRHLVAPRRDPHAGCAFRGPRGCSLQASHRPGRCVHYTCEALRREIHTRGRLDVLEAKLDDLNRAMQRFAAVHEARREREVATSVIEALASAQSAQQRKPVE